MDDGFGGCFHGREFRKSARRTPPDSREVLLPLPLAGEVDALEERGGWGHLSTGTGVCGETPTPALPRKREREQTAVATSQFLFSPAPAARSHRSRRRSCV